MNREVTPRLVPGTKVTEAYARMLARLAYFWAWPLVNIYNKRLAFAQAPEPGLMNGVVPFAPLNSIAMLTDYVDPGQRFVACPNQDVVYGGGIAALDLSPVVLQVPDFGGRFWVYQVVDLRTDGFADLGAMYRTKPGFYLLAGPRWKGDVPSGITQVFRSSTSTAFVGPRVFQSDSAEDKQAAQQVIGSIDMYPVSAYDGRMKRRDWANLPKFKGEGSGSKAETRWVFPEKFFEQLPLVLDDAPAVPGEEALYAQLRETAEIAKSDAKLARAMIAEAKKADKELVAPLFEFRNFGMQLQHHWSTVNNGAAFGSDYFTRTAVGKSNILVNKPNETKYFYQDLDADGKRLNAKKKYTITFAEGQVPPVKGFWSLTMYNSQHFFERNAIKRYSVGTKNKDLVVAADGSLTIYVQADKPRDAAQRTNWLPAPKNQNFSLYIRAYWPESAVTSGRWTPPPVRVSKG